MAREKKETGGSWRTPWMQVGASTIILAGVLVFLYPQIASWFAQREQSRVVELAQDQLADPPYDDPEVVSEEIARAHEYNDALASGAIYEANENVATADGEVTDSDAYENLLNLGNGFMGRVQYEDLDIDLPIYHGTDDETLLRGVGHLEGTSLPVGGIGTRSVLTAHRGLPEATLFNDLDQAEVGDLITVTTFDQVFAYEVVEVRVIEPDQTEAILPDPDRDLITLVTCTPLGINSHRILVTAERVEPLPADAEAAALADSELPRFPWWIIILAATITILGVGIWRGGRRSVPATDNSGEGSVADKNDDGQQAEGDQQLADADTNDGDQRLGGDQPLVDPDSRPESDDHQSEGGAQAPEDDGQAVGSESSEAQHEAGRPEDSSGEAENESSASGEAAMSLPPRKRGRHAKPRSLPGE